MEYLPEFLTVVVIHLLAVMSPGPDFALVSRNSFVYSRRAGVFSAMGIALGLGVHVIYSLVGIGLLISQSIVVFSIIKYIGAAYLIYLGVRSLLSKKKTATAEVLAEKPDITKLAALKQGFLTNTLNPKVTLFFFALFTQVINPQTPRMIQALYGLEMMTMTFIWFSLVAFMLSHPILTTRFKNTQHYIEKGMGVALVALGIKVAVSK